MKTITLAAIGCLYASAALSYVLIDYEEFCGEKPDQRWPGSRFVYVNDIVLEGANDGTKWPITNWRACNTSATFDLSMLLFEDYLKYEDNLENFVPRTLPRKTCVRIFNTQNPKFKVAIDEGLDTRENKDKVLVLYCRLVNSS